MAGTTNWIPKESEYMKLFIALILLSTFAHGQSVYKCTDKRGNAIYSDKPCKGVKGVEEELSVKAPALNGTQIADGEKVDALRAKWNRDKLTSGIRQAERDIIKYQRAMSKKLAKLEEEQKYATNNLAGAHYHSGLSTKMQAVTQKYNTLIESKRELIKRNQAKLDKLDNNKE